MGNDSDWEERKEEERKKELHSERSKILNRTSARISLIFNTDLSKRLLDRYRAIHRTIGRVTHNTWQGYT